MSERQTVTVIIIRDRFRAVKHFFMFEEMKTWKGGGGSHSSIATTPKNSQICFCVYANNIESCFSADGYLTAHRLMGARSSVSDQPSTDLVGTTNWSIRHVRAFSPSRSLISSSVNNRRIDLLTDPSIANSLDRNSLLFKITKERLPRTADSRSFSLMYSFLYRERASISYR